MNDLKHLFHQLPAIEAVCGERRQRNPFDACPTRASVLSMKASASVAFRRAVLAAILTLAYLRHEKVTSSQGTVQLEIELSWT
jgi:hypothetical protein